MRLHPQGLGGALSIGPFTRLDADADQGWFVRVLVNHSAANPIREQLVGFRSDFKAFASPMLNRHGWLQQQQTLGGRGWKDTASASFFGDLSVITPRIVTEDREFESVLALGLGVA